MSRPLICVQFIGGGLFRGSFCLAGLARGDFLGRLSLYLETLAVEIDLARVEIDRVFTDGVLQYSRLDNIRCELPRRNKLREPLSVDGEGARVRAADAFVENAIPSLLRRMTFFAVVTSGVSM